MKKFKILILFLSINLIAKKEEAKKIEKQESQKSKECNPKSNNFCDCLINETNYIPTTKDLDVACKRCNANQITKLEMVEYCDKSTGCKDAYKELVKHKKAAKKALKPHINRVKKNKQKLEEAKKDLDDSMKQLHIEAQKYSDIHPEHKVALQDFMEKCNFEKHKNKHTKQKDESYKEEIKDFAKKAEKKVEDFAQTVEKKVKELI